MDGSASPTSGAPEPAARLPTDLGLVRRERNCDAARGTSWRNRIADNAALFWYRFVHPNRSRLETGAAEEVWSDRVVPGLATGMGGVFEGICREAYGPCHAGWGLAGARQWSRWEGVSRDRRAIEIRIVADLDDGTFLTGEIKWSSRPLKYDVHVHLPHNPCQRMALPKRSRARVWYDGVGA
jgi:hypothetical protein